MTVVEEERGKAKTYSSTKAAAAAHLREPIDRSPKVWIMGHISRNAITVLCGLPQTNRKLKPPYLIQQRPKFFVSAYFTRFDTPDTVRPVVEHFQRFRAEEQDTPDRTQQSSGAETTEPSISPADIVEPIRHLLMPGKKTLHSDKRPDRTETPEPPDNLHETPKAQDEGTMDVHVVEEIEQEFKRRFPNEPTREHQFLTDRIRRSLSWAKKASTSRLYSPGQFAELWIGLNALYGTRRYERPDNRHRPTDERDRRNDERRDADDFSKFVDNLMTLTRRGNSSELTAAINQIKKHAKRVIRNQYLWNEYWRGEVVVWQKLSERHWRAAESSIREENLKEILERLFPRLAVLRSQIIHGGAAEDTKKNKGSLEPAVDILNALLPPFLRLMVREGTGVEWPAVAYPAAGTPGHPRPRGRQ